MVFNLSNEPSLKYSLALLADQGPDQSRWTSTRLRVRSQYVVQYVRCAVSTREQYLE